MSIRPLVQISKDCLKRSASKLKRLLREVPEIEAGPAMGLRFDAGPGTRLFISGEYERPVQEAITSQVRTGDVFYDIGANLGFFSVLVGRLVGNTGAVYAFEPVPANVSVLRRNARLNALNNIAVLRIACSNRVGRSELLLAHHVGGAVLKSSGVPPDLAGSLMVDTSSIDSLVESRRIKPPHFVKIDVEGAEMDVLQGMESVLRNWAPKILLEVDDKSAEGCEEKLSLCRRFLHDVNYPDPASAQLLYRRLLVCTTPPCLSEIYIVSHFIRFKSSTIEPQPI